MPNPDVTSWLAQLAMSLLVATGAAWVTVQFSLRRFYREKWWEKRFEAYAAVLDALHKLNRTVLEEHVKLVQPHIAIAYPPFTKDRLIEPMAVIQKAIDSGGLLVSESMVDLLRAFAMRLGDASPLGDKKALALSIRIIGETLPQATAIATRDLGLAPWKWPRIRARKPT